MLECLLTNKMVSDVVPARVRGCP